MTKIDQMTTSPRALPRPSLPKNRPYESQSQSQSQSDSAAADMAASTNEPDAPHIDAIDWSDPAGPLGENGQAETLSPEDAARAERRASFISKDSFYGNFKMLFFVGSVAPVSPFPIAALAIAPEEEAAARAASDVIYDIIAEVTWLEFLLGENTIWAERASVLMMFFGVKYLAIRAELEARREAAKAAREVQHDTRGGEREGAFRHSETPVEDTQKL